MLPPSTQDESHPDSQPLFQAQRESHYHWSRSSSQQPHIRKTRAHAACAVNQAVVGPLSKTLDWAASGSAGPSLAYLHVRLLVAVLLAGSVAGSSV